jgi:PAS domain S-box-containing protein
MSQKQKVQETREFRRKAEVNLSRMISKTVPTLKPENVEALVHELRVHQIELQLQNHELERTRQEAEDSRDRYRELYEAIPIGYVTIDLSGRMYDVNPVGASLLGLDRESVRSYNFFFFFVNGESDAMRRLCQQVLAAQEPSVCELNMRKVDERRFTAALQATPVQVGAGKHERLRIAFRDITQQKEAEETLRQYQVELEANRIELQDLLEKLIGAQEEERRRIACELHDDHCQRLTALILEAGTLEKLFAATIPSVGRRMESMKEKLSGVLDDFRHLTHELHPRHLDTVSLSLSMHSYIKEFATYSELHIDFKEEDVPSHLPMPITICLYRLLQESLGNIRKHANATHVTVNLSAGPDEVKLVVTDDGSGFDLHGKTGAAQKGLGLTSMQERIRPLHGTVIIDSGPGRGTSITVTIPMPCTT